MGEDAEWTVAVRCKSSVIDRNLIKRQPRKETKNDNQRNCFSLYCRAQLCRFVRQPSCSGRRRPADQGPAAAVQGCQMKNDASWAQQHLADGFVAGNSWGDWETKDEFIKDLQNKTNKWKSGAISDVQVATFGSNIAVSHYKFTYDAEIRGTHRARTVICSDTWINDSGTWKTAATHCSMVKGK